MANTITSLIPDAYAALNVVSREMTGLVLSVNRDSRADRLAIGQTLRNPQAPANTAGKDITAAMSLPARVDQVITNTPFTLSKSRAFGFSWEDEEVYALEQGPGILSINQQQIAQAMRAALGEISADIYAAARVKASRAYGTGGTTAFATNLAESAQLKKILDDNGAPLFGRSLVFDTTAGAAVRTLLNNPLTANQVLAQGSTNQGVLIDVNNFALREDNAITTVTKGTAASATTNNAGYAVGATLITLASAGTGTILAGDVVVFAGDSNKYVVVSGDADVSGGGTITLAEPGLRVAMSAATKTITLTSNFTANLGFSRDAILLGTRLPMRPKKDMAIMVETITDPLTGISFELAEYPGYHMSHYEVGICWGVAVEKPQHLAIMLG
jgi:hypothetical protein